MKIGQALVFVAALGLLGLYTVSDQLARDEGFHVRVTWVSLALLGVAAFVVILPRVITARGPADAPDVDLPGRAHDAALTATAVALEPTAPDGGVLEAGSEGRALFAREPSPALARAARDPMTSIELSRRALASELRGLAAAAGVNATAPSLVGFADQLYGAGRLSAAEASAIGELAAVIDAARESGSVGTGVAQDVDYATQLLVPVLEERLRRTMRRPIPRPEFGAIGAPDGRVAAAPYDQAAADAAGADAAAEEEEDDGIDIDLRERADVDGASEPASEPEPELAPEVAAEPQPESAPEAERAPEAVAWRPATADS
jgi:hypothetical protein